MQQLVLSLRTEIASLRLENAFLWRHVPPEVAQQHGQLAALRQQQDTIRQTHATIFTGAPAETDGPAPTAGPVAAAAGPGSEPEGAGDVAAVLHDLRSENERLRAENDVLRQRQQVWAGAWVQDGPASFSSEGGAPSRASAECQADSVCAGAWADAGVFLWGSVRPCGGAVCGMWRVRRATTRAEVCVASSNPRNGSFCGSDTEAARNKSSGVGIVAWRSCTAHRAEPRFRHARDLPVNIRSLLGAPINSCRTHCAGVCSAGRRVWRGVCAGAPPCLPACVGQCPS